MIPTVGKAGLDGSWFVTLYAMGRIMTQEYRLKTALRRVANGFPVSSSGSPPTRTSCLHNVADGDRAALTALLAEHGVRTEQQAKVLHSASDRLSRPAHFADFARRIRRYLPDLLTRIEGLWQRRQAIRGNRHSHDGLSGTGAPVPTWRGDRLRGEGSPDATSSGLAAMKIGRLKAASGRTHGPGRRSSRTAPLLTRYASERDARGNGSATGWPAFWGPSSRGQQPELTLPRPEARQEFPSRAVRCFRETLNFMKTGEIAAINVARTGTGLRWISCAGSRPGRRSGHRLDKLRPGEAGPGFTRDVRSSRISRCRGSITGTIVRPPIDTPRTWTTRPRLNVKQVRTAMTTAHYAMPR